MNIFNASMAIPFPKIPQNTFYLLVFGMASFVLTTTYLATRTTVRDLDWNSFDAQDRGIQYVSALHELRDAAEHNGPNTDKARQQMEKAQSAFMEAQKLGTWLVEEEIKNVPVWGRIMQISFYVAAISLLLQWRQVQRPKELVMSAKLRLVRAKADAAEANARIKNAKAAEVLRQPAKKPRSRRNLGG